jgi:hypothetical protein
MVPQRGVERLLILVCELLLAIGRILLLSRLFSFGSLFYPENGGDIFIRNVLKTSFLEK